MSIPKPDPDDIPRDALPGEPFTDDQSNTLTDEDRAFGATMAQARQHSADDEDNCFWEKQWGPICLSGQLRERWCYICCSGGVCETVSCETRIVGSC